MLQHFYILISTFLYFHFHILCRWCNLYAFLSALRQRRLQPFLHILHSFHHLVSHISSSSPFRMLFPAGDLSQPLLPLHHMVPSLIAPAHRWVALSLLYSSLYFIFVLHMFSPSICGFAQMSPLPLPFSLFPMLSHELHFSPFTAKGD